MSVASMMRHSVRHEAHTVRKDTGVGEVVTYSTVAGNEDVLCDAQPASGTATVLYDQEKVPKLVTFFLIRDIGAQAGDRLVWRNIPYLMTAYYEASLGRDLVWKFEGEAVRK